jgi:hypothetical protein
LRQTRRERDTREKKVIIFFFRAGGEKVEGQDIKKNAIIINTGLLLSAESAERLKKKNRKAFYFQLSNYSIQKNKRMRKEKKKSKKGNLYHVLALNI